MLGLIVDRSKSLSISRQIYDQIRDRIMFGELDSGYKLPPSRQLAESLEVSRNIIIEVYDQLLSEGFIESRIGSGTYVASGIHKSASPGYISDWNLKKKEHRRNQSDIIDFASGIPDLMEFPFKTWEKCLKEAYDSDAEEMFGYGSVTGDPELRETISDYLYNSKGVHCSPENILITSGASQAFFLIAKVIGETLTDIYMEDPSVDFIQDIFIKSGFRLRSISVDDEGACVQELFTTNEKKLIFLTPSFQFPTGSILSIQRKQALVDWARKTGSIIIEDGYDSEFRYRGILTPPLLAMDYEHILYVGTFSKNLSPGLRLGYLIVPPQLKQAFKQVKSDLNIFCSQIDQKTLARFIGNGCLERHIYQMKKIYGKKQQTLTQLIRQLLKNQVNIASNDAGMHLILEIPQTVYDRLDWRRSEEYGIRVYPIQDFYYEKPDHKNRLILGYGNLSLQDIEKGAERLNRFIKTAGK